MILIYFDDIQRISFDSLIQLINLIKITVAEPIEGWCFIELGLRPALHSNSTHFHAKNRCFLAKMWRFIQDGVVIKSGVLKAQIRYFI